jgi:two-component system cell cycle sensor histidine kinase/response regulator CckA
MALLMPREIMNRTSSIMLNPDMARSTRGTILVVDDEPAVCHVTGNMLELHGFSVLYAQSGEQALRLVDQHHGPIHLLVTDIVMPHMSGPQLAQQLRFRQPNLPVLFISGLVSYGNFQGVMGGWMLKKPYTPSMLASKVCEVLAASA